MIPEWLEKVESKIAIHIKILMWIFIVAKMTGAGDIAEWSWWMVTAPVWVHVALFASINVAVIYLQRWRDASIKRALSP